jgi:transposase
MTQERAFNGAGVVAFLKHLPGQVAGKIVLIWDRAKIYRCQAVKDFLGSGAARRLRLVLLPAYAPDLNPDEGVWRWLKRSLGNVCCKEVSELRYELGLAIQLYSKPSCLT